MHYQPNIRPLMKTNVLSRESIRVFVRAGKDYAWQWWSWLTAYITESVCPTVQVDTTKGWGSR